MQEYTVIRMHDNSETLVSIRREKGYSVARFSEEVARTYPPCQAVQLRRIQRPAWRDPLDPAIWANTGEVLRDSREL